MKIFNEKVEEEKEKIDSKPTYVKANYRIGIVSFETTENPKEQISRKELKKIFGC